VTLIELLIAVALGFILILLGVPAYNTWTADAEVSSAASAIADGLRTASAEALKQNTAVEFVLTPAVGWVARIAATGTVLTQERFAEGAKRASITTSLPGTTTVTFNSLGGVETVNADTSAPITLINIDMGGVEKRPLRVLVGVTRNGIRVCDPKFSWPADPKGC
jgi:type IV fimbrial biogenesis protein FimT